MRSQDAIPTWADHQVISRPTKSRLPSPDGALIRSFHEITEPSMSTHGVLPAGSGKGSGKGRGSGTGKAAPSALVSMFDEAWKHWPKKDDRKLALERFPEAVKRYPGDDPQYLADTIALYGDAYLAKYPTRDLWHFIPALAVWLGRDRWTDDLPVPTGSSQPVIGKGHTRDLEWQAQLERAAEFDRQQKQQQLEIEQ